MLKIQITLLAILIGGFAFVSCDRVQQVSQPVLPAEDAMNPGVQETLVVINELMASNSDSFADPQGEYDDWLELHNLTDEAVLLTGMYLTDKEDDLRKWEFPENTEIPPNGYLIVWLDEDENAPTGLHANFKLARGGETVMLVDTDARSNQVLDAITFGEQEKDTAFGRWPNGTGTFQVVQMTPGAQNMSNYNDSPQR